MGSSAPVGARVRALDPQDRRSTSRGSLGTDARRLLQLRGRHLFVLDTAGLVVASIAAFAIEGATLGSASAAMVSITAGALVLTARTLIDIALGLYARDWRHASVHDLIRIAAAAILGSVAGLSIALLLAVAGHGSMADLPHGYWPTELLFALVVLGGLRFGVRLTSEALSHRHAGGAVDPVPTLLYGAGRVGVLMARSARHSPAAGVMPVGFLDDDPSLAGTAVDGLRVFGGLDALESAIGATGATTMLITMPSAAGAVVRRVVEAALSVGLEVRTVPPLEHLLDGTVDAYRVRRVRVEDLLRRPAATEHSPEVMGVFRDRVVLITGGAGSIGSELARQVHALRPRRLILLDRAESPLYLIQRELEERAAAGEGGGEVVVRLGNVVSRSAIGRLVSAEKPDVILHAAAYKHVPMLEDHPADAVHVNVGGTLALLDAAASAGVGRFVLVSTDKAVRPSSVMGASKRIAEMLVADTARRTGRPYVSVRFGNVLGSAGSVVPIFQEQLDNGRPLTVTDAEMTRYFMTIPEAAWLILDAAALSRSGDVFVLDMGDPVRIVDLARDVARLAGRDPDSQPITITGLRPGEKLHEELYYENEHIEATAAPKVLRVRSEPPSAAIRDHVRALMMMAEGASDVTLRLAIHVCARGGTRAEEPLEPSGAGRRTVPIRVHTNRARDPFRAAPFVAAVQLSGRSRPDPAAEERTA
jgi:FlaA1/EpsC-like NDP-sugar epimerase